MRIATYNVENLFSRITAMAGSDEDKNAIVLADAAELQRLIELPVYGEADKTRMSAILKKHKALRDNGPFFLQETCGHLATSSGKITAKGRADWMGWIEWRRALVKAKAIENTGRIVSEIKADVLCFVEVESRPILRRFNEEILKPGSYPYVMLIDGNDDRGIDVGIASRYPIASMRSHVDDLDPATKRPIFSRDCAEFQVDLPGSRGLWILLNHFKSRGYGSPATNNARRKKQAQRVADILGRFDLKKQWVIVAGDFNELPKSDSLAPLLKPGSGLRNSFEKLPAEADRWTHRDDAIPSKNDQIDYLLVSEALWPRLQEVHIERRGIWSHTLKIRKKYPPLEGVTGDTSAASDHAAVWAEFDLG